MTAATQVQKATPRDLLKAELARFTPSYAKLLPKGYAPDRLITGALLAVQINPDLLKCTPISVATALARVAQWGMDVGLTAHLIPFGDTCTPVLDYKGLIRLMCRGGARKVEAHEVREGDVFQFGYGTESFIRHQPNGGNGPITHGYAIAQLKSGATVFEVMTAAEMDAIRQAKSKSWKSGPLPKWWVRKCVIRQLAKYVDQSPDLIGAISTDEEPVPVGQFEVTEDLLKSLEPPQARGVPALTKGSGYPERPANVTPDGEEVEAPGGALDRTLAAEEKR